jgi:hypothetical protein
LGNWVRPTWGSCIAIYKVSPLLLLLGKKEEDKVAHSISMIAGMPGEVERGMRMRDGHKRFLN